MKLVEFFQMEKASNPTPRQGTSSAPSDSFGQKSDFKTEELQEAPENLPPLPDDEVFNVEVLGGSGGVGA
jgi:hypothetical protein